MTNPNIEQYWQSFLATLPSDSPYHGKPYVAEGFGDNPELADELVGGVLTAGPDRLTAASLKGVPQVISLGALDMVNFGAKDSVPAQFRNRNLYVHNPMVTLMRTTVQENREAARWIADKLNAFDASLSLLIPEGGVSALDAPGMAFYDRETAARLCAVYNIFAFASIIPLLFIIPRLSSSMHPGNGGNPGFNAYDLDSRMRMIFYPAVIAWFLVGVWIATLRVRYRKANERIIDSGL